MKIAVSYEDGNIGMHFGHAQYYAVYDYPDDQDIMECTKTVIDCSDRHGHQQMADLMKENGIAAVITGQIGAEAKALLLSYGIVPVAGYQGDADTAADMLITGQLPIIEGGGACSGGCGGCGGSCGGDCSHDKEGNCGCGCGCH